MVIKAILILTDIHWKDGFVLDNIYGTQFWENQI
jgi:hypothetical protein